MSQNRVYFVSHGSHIETGVSAECRDDDEAWDQVSKLVSNGKQTEIWKGARCLGQVDGQRIESFLESCSVQLERSRKRVEQSWRQLEEIAVSQSKAIEQPEFAND